MLPLSDLPDLWGAGSLSTAEAAGLLKCCEKTVCRLLRREGIPHERIGRGYAIPRRAVLEWVARRQDRGRRLRLHAG